MMPLNVNEQGPGQNADPAAPLVSAWQVSAEAGEPEAVVRVRNLQSVMAAGRDAWGRSAKPQPVFLSSEVSFSKPFETASAKDALSAETVHYGTLSKTLLGSMAPFSPDAIAVRKTEAATVAGKGHDSDQGLRAPSTAAVLELLWVKLTGRVEDGSCVALPLDQVPFLDASRLRSLSLSVHMPKASLLGSGVSLTTKAAFKAAGSLEGGEEGLKKQNPVRSYARSLRLHGLHVPTLIGVNANEREAKQMVVVDVEIDRFDASEDIHAELEKTVVKTIDDSSFETLEALGTHIAKRILNEFRIGNSPQPMRERGWQVKVCLEKPIAVPFADCPSVEVRVW
ncbi:Dihydroneopterin aldolase-domain-containing protein [Xylariaceae sp. FL0594]|nr:Dihydroneopterin aldolase-domain-containing protein [Xylariaceae sp. FL0594]